MKNKITIVGPKPEKRSHQKRLEGAKFEAILLMAKYNKSFRKLLLTDRTKAIQESKLELNDKEKFILFNIDNRQLQSTIRSFNIPGISKKSLANWKTAAAVLLLITTLSTKEAKSQAVSIDTSTIESTPIVQGLTSDFYYLEISGRVIDSASHTPLISATVRIKGNKQLVETNKQGQYSIRALAGDTLIFEHFNYFPKEIICSEISIVDVALVYDEVKANLYKRGSVPSESPKIHIDEKKKKKRK